MTDRQNKKGRSEQLLEKLRDGGTFTLSQQISMTIRLALPAMMAQLSSIIMEYIDAAMVGHLGANASASIGLVSSTTWLFGGLSMAATTGFTVQIAQYIGAKKDHEARGIMRQGMAVTFAFSIFLLLTAVAIGGSLPGWLSSDTAIHADASAYFTLFMMAMPAFVMNSFAGGALQASGDMKTPGILNSVSCFMDILFNALMIYPTGTFAIGSLEIPGAGLGVAGAATGTLITAYITSASMLCILLFKSRLLRLRRDEKLIWHKDELKAAWKLALPIGIEQILMCGAYIASTAVVAPLGSIAISAHSFSITAESLCYMPGYGIASAAATIIGQSIGAGRLDLTRRLSWISASLGIAIMTGTGILMFIFAPQMIGLLSPVEEVRRLGAQILRIEAFAEPFYAAAIVSNGIFRGAGDTLVPSCMNFACMWLVRLPLSWFLAYPCGLGLQGVWIAMASELGVRGAVFLVRLSGCRWMKSVLCDASEN